MTGSQTPLNHDASTRRVAIVAARFNGALVDQLVEGASRAWRRYGGADSRLAVQRVPGAFELPLAALKFAASGEYHAVIALGCVIRGDTPHFDYVAGECARGLMDAGLATGVPVISSPKAAMPCNCLGVDSTCMRVTPRSLRICAPMP